LLVVGSANISASVVLLKASSIIVPVVMKQCITCHQGKKEGELLGAIVYEVPVIQ